ncbi:unnamed protein product [Taenia asiatica]|uniref:Uncharacterized protein n=1 Tax=Taenia asiatica TaxID=60517 RepID=A0A0R3WCB3_TAEAS|nr:unnamed protein product [Taenia asiatica]
MDAFVVVVSGIWVDLLVEVDPPVVVITGMGTEPVNVANREFELNAPSVLLVVLEPGSADVLRRGFEVSTLAVDTDSSVVVATEAESESVDVLTEGFEVDTVFVVIEGFCVELLVEVDSSGVVIAGVEAGPVDVAIRLLEVDTLIVVVISYACALAIKLMVR